MSYRLRPAHDYKDLLAAGAQVVDVRAPSEFARGSTDEAVNIPVEDLYLRLKELDRDRCVVLLGNTGEERPVRAAVLLRACFFPNVVVLVGGLRALQGLPSLLAA